MNKIYRVLAVILVYCCLLSATALAAEYEEDEYFEIVPSIVPGDVAVF